MWKAILWYDRRVIKRSIIKDTKDSETSHLILTRRGRTLTMFTFCLLVLPSLVHGRYFLIITPALKYQSRKYIKKNMNITIRAILLIEPGRTHRKVSTSPHPEWWFYLSNFWGDRRDKTLSFRYICSVFKLIRVIEKFLKQNKKYKNIFK